MTKFVSKMQEPFKAENIEAAFECIDKTAFIDELVDSVSRLKVYSAVLQRSIARVVHDIDVYKRKYAFESHGGYSHVVGKFP